MLRCSEGSQLWKWENTHRSFLHEAHTFFSISSFPFLTTFYVIFLSSFTSFNFFPPNFSSLSLPPYYCFIFFLPFLPPHHRSPFFLPLCLLFLPYLFFILYFTTCFFPYLLPLPFPLLYFSFLLQPSTCSSFLSQFISLPPYYPSFLLYSSFPSLSCLLQSISILSFPFSMSPILLFFLISLFFSLLVRDVTRYKGNAKILKT